MSEWDDFRDMGNSTPTQPKPTPPVSRVVPPTLKDSGNRPDSEAVTDLKSESNTDQNLKESRVVPPERKRGDRVNTPSWVAADMVRHFEPAGRILEPFKGGGVFLDLLPDAEWCEIDEGKDFFRWREVVDWIITNPPYSKLRPVFRHAATLADNIVFLVPLRNVFSGNGFVREVFVYGGIVEIRVYGTGGSVGFPMGNCIGAMYFRRDYSGPTTWTFYPEAP